jgi:hypothetical protein
MITDPLVEYHDVERPAFGRFAVSDGRLSGISIISQSDDYAERALAPFLDGLRSTHPDELDEVWTTVDGEFTPLHTVRAAELQAAHLAAYLAGVDR